MLIEGIKYNNSSNSFEIDFNNNNSIDIIKINEIPIHQTKLGKHTYFYGYKIEDKIPSEIKNKFVNCIKNIDTKQVNEKDFYTLVNNAVSNLDENIDLFNFSVIVYPESRSKLNVFLSNEISRRINNPELVSIELLKNLKDNITFDTNRFKTNVIELKNENGKFLRDSTTRKVLGAIPDKIIKKIKNNDYFSISSITKYRDYINNFLIFKTIEDENLFKTLINKDVLIIDDVSTSGSTLDECIKVIRSVNQTNHIVVFSLIGNNKYL